MYNLCVSIHACEVHGTMSESLLLQRSTFICALQTFLPPLTHSLAKLPKAAIPLMVIVGTVFGAHRLLSLHRLRHGGMRLTSMFRSCIEHRQGSSPSVLLNGVSQQGFQAASLPFGRTFGRQTCTQDCLLWPTHHHTYRRFRKRWRWPQILNFCGDSRLKK